MPLMESSAWDLMSSRDLSTTTELTDAELDIFVEAVPVLRVLGKGARADLHGLLHVVRFRKGDVVVSQGDVTDNNSCMYFVRSGSVDVTIEGVDDPGTARSVRHLVPGEFFGELALSSFGTSLSRFFSHILSRFSLSHISHMSLIFAQVLRARRPSPGVYAHDQSAVGGLDYPS